jgi:hypothetical protein
MTINSARSQVELRGRDSGICMPTAIDAMLPVSKLPDEYYDACAENYSDPNGSHNKAISYILKDFFQVEPMPESDSAAIAKFNAFGASPQVYMPDVPYNYPDMGEYFVEGGVTPQQMRFVNILETARANGCNILFTNNKGEFEHVSGLHMIDEGPEPEDAAYVIRDFVDIQNDQIYFPYDLAGIPQILGNREAAEFTPLPTVQRSYFPEGQASYELIVVPPDPKL